MNRILIAIILLSFVATVTACHSNTSNSTRQPDTTGYTQHPKTPTDSDKNDSIAIAQVQQLPEFNRIFKWYQTTNKDTSKHFAVTIAEEPSTGFNYYWVKIGEDTPDNFVTIEHFYVDAKNLSVHYLDAVSDSTYTVEKWRKSGKDRWMK